MPQRTTDRPDPEKLLSQVQSEDADLRRGLLKVFLGYASGVGKSLRMLDEARRRRERGEDVVVGATQPRASPEVEALLGKLEVIPQRQVAGIPVMDIPGILRRHPEVCVVDGLAYDNPPRSRNGKRWQDVEELLAAGTSVLSSVNLQHIAEYRERVEKITGKIIVETLPLSFLKSADEIEVVDAPPSICMEHAEGGAGTPDSRDGDWLPARPQGLSELREMALLLAADIVDHQLEAYLHRHGIEQLWGTQERILVCAKSRTNAVRMIESGRRNADRFHGELLVVHVRRPDEARGQGAGLAGVLDYARSLGAQVELLESEDWVDAVLRFARQHGVTQIFISHSRRENWWERLFVSTEDRLIRAAEGMDVRVFPQ
jgi:two-component system, OmpR family, sensor histidine kinase KdpD